MRAAARSWSLTALLAIAACSGAPPEAPNNAAVADLETLPPDESIATPSEDLADGAIERPLASGPVASGERLPPVLYGRWGLTAADCASDEPSRGVMTIAANGIRFFNSFARPTATATFAPDGVRGEFAFVGEAGRSWTGPLSLTVEGGRLTRIDSEGDSRQLYMRCL